MFIVVAWGLVIGLVMLLAFGPDLAGRRAGARDERVAKGEDRRSATHSPAQDSVAR